VTTELDLIRLLLHPGVRLHDPGELTRSLTDLAAQAQRLGLQSELSTSLSLLARAYHWGWGDIPRARALMRRAMQLIEAAHEPNLEPLLESARCLAYLEMDMARTGQLFDELAALDSVAADSVQYQWGLGLVTAWRGDVAAARAALGRAIELAVRRGEHWAAFECSARLALLELEAGEIATAGSVSAELAPLADKLGDGSERHYAEAIAALCGLARDDVAATADFDRAIGVLEQMDARFLVPDLHGIAAELHHRASRLDDAQDRAELAVRVAREVARPFEEARGQALLACIAAERGDVEGVQALLRSVARLARTSGLPGHVEGLRREAEQTLARSGG
jgi:tetratricopeptide (TPR) repeat protein